MEPEPTTHTVATNDLIARWREDEEGLLAEAKKALSWRSWGFYRWRVMVAFAFWREPTLDPYAIGYGDGLLQAADELEAALAREAAAHEETARELAAWLYGYVEVARQMVTDPKVVEEIAATLASVRRATLRDAWQVCPESGGEHEWGNACSANSCKFCYVLRSAISPADVKGENQ